MSQTMQDQRDEPVIPVWPIDDRIALKLLMIKQIGQGSTTANSLPHVARIAEEALQLINTYRAGAADESKAPHDGAPDMRRLTAAIAKAYGYLWCVNCEPGTPRQYSPEKAAYAARKELRDLLTKEQRAPLSMRPCRRCTKRCARAMTRPQRWSLQARPAPPTSWAMTTETGVSGRYQGPNLIYGTPEPPNSGYREFYDMTTHTGWDTGLCQDYCRGLALWFASRLDARHVIRRWLNDSRTTHDPQNTSPAQSRREGPQQSGGSV